jgi:predicted O-linked N-acetylglucosamine transferase (SPINDLY family)
MPQPTNQQLLQQGLRHHQAGRFPDAEATYRQILARDPNDAEALHLLGMLAKQAGQFETAIQLLRQAIRLKPSHAAAHNNLGNTLKAFRQYEEAIAEYREAIRLRPDLADAFINLGNALMALEKNDEAIAAYRRSIQLAPGVAEVHSNLGHLLTTMGRLEEAIAACREAVRLRPNLPEAHNNLANALKKSVKTDEAIDSYREAIRLRPDFTEAHYNLGISLQTAGRRDEAIAAYRQAIQLKPDYAEAWSDLGNAIRETEDLDEATWCYRRSINANPNYAPAHYNLGLVLFKQEKVDEAIESHQTAVLLKPDFVEALCSLGNLLRDANRASEAIPFYRRAIAARPDHADAHYLLGTALQKTDAFADAIAAYRETLRLKPDHDMAHNDLGNAFYSDGQLDESIAAYRQAIRLNPRLAIAHSNLGFALSNVGQIDQSIAASRQALELKPDYQKGHGGMLFSLLYHPGYDTKMLFDELQQWNRAHAASIERFTEYPNSPDPQRRLRVGYVSPDFRQHTISMNLIPLFKHHDRRQFEIFCYANVARPDDLTAEYRGYADQWRDISSLTDAEAIEQIREDQIDILVDLALHTAQNRVLIFAAKPAPVQATFAGYPGSTGLQTIDYRLTDAYLDPPRLDDQFYSESSYRLPNSFWCYEPLGTRVEVNPLPAKTNGYLTFGSLNSFRKVNEPVLLLWAQVLKAVDNSRLIMLSPPGSHRRRALEFLLSKGVEGDRVEFVTQSGRSKYLEYYHRIDISVDTLPYNGHITSLDSIWMGVPVVTLIGKTVVGRAGVSLLTNVGLPELIAHTPEQFVQITSELAGNLNRLAELRATLRGRLESSPLMDAPGYTRDVESAYRQMWSTWCSRK